MGNLSLVLWATDIDALVAFLETAAEARQVARHPGFASLEVGETTVEVHADEAYRGHPWYDALMREGAARGIGSELRVATSDVDSAWQRALDAGGIEVQSPISMGDTYECVVMGPDGYLFSFWRKAA